MIVPEPRWWFLDIDPMSSDYHSGSIGSEVEREPDDKPRRPIGFRMPERQEPPDDPSWLLL